MKVVGVLKKLEATLSDPIAYDLPLDETRISLNALVGQEIELTYLQEMFCIQCQRKMSKSFQNGYCFPCYRMLLECNLCLIHPERCKFPDEDCCETWAHAHCKQEHIVYIAHSSHLKVGITRKTQVPTRWIDQGATEAIALFQVSNRKYAGLLETVFKKYVSDKTNWRKLLTPSDIRLNMIEEKHSLLQNAASDLDQLEFSFKSLDEASVLLNYPLQGYPSIVCAFSLEEENVLRGKLIGIKGQYLLFDKGACNIRKHAGYKVSFSVI